MKTERPILFSAPMVRAILSNTKTQTRRVVKDTGLYAIDAAIHGPETAARELLALASRCPYGIPGDRLWVREAWGFNPDFPGLLGHIFFRADCGHEHDGIKWRPSIHMPRAASRITLEVTEVRVERLAIISEADAIAEGLKPLSEGTDRTWTVDADPRSEHESPRDTYRWLWESINGPGAWDKSPWVWVVEFRRVKP